MNVQEMVLARIPDTQETATGVDTAAVITLPVPGAQNRWLIESLSISMNGDPAASVSFTIVSDGVTLERLEFPAAACAPYSSNCVYKGAMNSTVVLTLPALGTGIRGTISVRAIKAANV
jgi:hypothetical protein